MASVSPSQPQLPPWGLWAGQGGEREDLWWRALELQGRHRRAGEDPRRDDRCHRKDDTERAWALSWLDCGAILERVVRGGGASTDVNAAGSTNMVANSRACCIIIQASRVN
eukprot:3035868-Pyramimonas_sp.AAC.1